MKIAVACFLSSITTAVILGLLTMNPLVLIMTFVTYIIPFLIGTMCFQYLHKRVWVHPRSTQREFVRRVTLGWTIAICMLFCFNVLDGIFNGFEFKRSFRESQAYLPLVALAGFIMPMMYTLAEFVER